MTKEALRLAAEFDPVTHQDWLDAVDKVLKGKDFDRVLRSKTPDGIVIEPLYTKEDQPWAVDVPGDGVSLRASNPAGQTSGWDVRQRHVIGDPAAANAAILHDLNRGVTSVELVVDAGATDVLEGALSDVLLDLAPVALLDSGDGIDAAKALLAVAERSGVPASEALLDLGCDPIGALASSAAIDIDAALAQVGELGAACAGSHPHVRVVRASGVRFAEAGATPATELAVTVGAGVAYARALVAQGVSEADAFNQVLLNVSVGTDQFGDIAKLRALRIMWQRVAAASGVPAADTKIQASMARNVMTKRDPWVNMLRGTIGCFAAAVGGADIVLVHPFDALVGQPDDLGLRIARNTHLALMEESNLHRVIDPAGGSWYVETLTSQLGEQAWSIFQSFEAEGGVVAAIQSGTVQGLVDEARAETAKHVATRTRPITGVSEFPNLAEEPLQRKPLAVADVGSGDGLQPWRLAEDYEALRDAADAASTAPTVFLANMGPVAAHTARAGWAQNFFEAGGIAAVTNEGFTTPAEAAQAFAQSGAALVVICSSDALYDELGEATAEALAQAGASRIYLAGNPGDRAGAYQAAGVHEFIHVGCNVLESLQRAHQVQGIGPTEVAQ